MLSSHTLLRFEVHPHKVENLHRLLRFREGMEVGGWVDDSGRQKMLLLGGFSNIL